MIGAAIEAVRRRGKVVLVDTDRADDRAALRDDRSTRRRRRAPIERLEYASGAMTASSGTDLRLRYTSPAASGAGVAVQRSRDASAGSRSIRTFDTSGVDIFAVTAEAARCRVLDVEAAACSSRRCSISASCAGLGNLCADEVLWWAGVAPSRPCDTLDAG